MSSIRINSLKHIEYRIDSSGWDDFGVDPATWQNWLDGGVYPAGISAGGVGRDDVEQREEARQHQHRQYGLLVPSVRWVYGIVQPGGTYHVAWRPIDE
mgnify:FL=1